MSQYVAQAGLEFIAKLILDLYSMYLCLHHADIGGIHTTYWANPKTFISINCSSTKCTHHYLLSISSQVIFLVFKFLLLKIIPQGISVHVACILLIRLCCLDGIVRKRNHKITLHFRTQCMYPLFWPYSSPCPTNTVEEGMWRNSLNPLDLVHY